MTARTHTSSDSPGAGRRAPGLWLGTVTANNDPRQLGRVKVRVPGVGGQLELAWARVLFPYTGNKVGALHVPPVGAGVLVGFEAEDSNRPVVLGLRYDQVGDKTTAPAAATGDVDDVRDARGKDSVVGAGGVQLAEPDDPASPTYPHNKVLKTESGHLIEIDDTPGAERISITHGTSKSWLEFHPDGSVVLGAQSQLYELVDGDHQEHTTGSHDVVVEGDSSFKSRNHVASYESLKIRTLKKLLVEAIGELTLQSKTRLVAKAPVVEIGGGDVKNPMVTTGTHPFDYITGLPINGVPTILGG